MKLHRFKRILKKDELLTIETYANDKVNAVLEQIRNEIERLHYHPKLDFIKNDEVVEMALEIIDHYTKGDAE